MNMLLEQKNCNLRGTTSFNSVVGKKPYIIRKTLFGILLKKIKNKKDR